MSSAQEEADGLPSSDLPGLGERDRGLLRRGSELVLFARRAGCKGVALFRGEPGCAPRALPERRSPWL